MALFSFDTEDDSKGSAYLFNFYDVAKDKHHTFRNQLDALDFVCGQSDSRFWATNLEYDLNNLFRDHYDLLSYIFAGSRLLSAEIKSDNIKFYDSFNHWQLSVKKMGDRLGLPKLDFEHQARKPSTHEEWKKAITYCRRDTEITGKFVMAMADVYTKIGARLKMTMASTTLDFFERNFHGKPLNNPFTQEQIDWFHSGYYGGRTEIFFNEPVDGSIYYHDINSLYPSVMRDFEYPDLEGGFYETDEIIGKYGVAEVEIHAPKSSIPYLPCRTEGRLIFPTGRFVGTYTFFEITEAKKLGYKVKRVIRAIRFARSCSPFKDFIESLYTRRLSAKAAGDGLMDLSYKGLMNYCYGKFAQKADSTKLLPLSQTKLRPLDTVFGNLVLRKEKGQYPRYANCVWAMHVTAYARHRLFLALNEVERKKGLLLYCDTDSVIYKSRTQILEHSKSLGEFKLEEVYDFAHFKLPKLYSLRKAEIHLYKSKGVPSAKSKEFFETGKARFLKPNKLRESLRRKYAKKATRQLIPNYWDTQEKEIQTTYDKRVVLKGGSTKPIELKPGIIPQRRVKCRKTKKPPSERKSVLSR